MDAMLGQDLESHLNPMYFNIDEVPDEWREETQVLLSDGTIRGDRKRLMSIRKDDLQNAIVARRIRDGR